MTKNIEQKSKFSQIVHVQFVTKPSQFHDWNMWDDWIDDDEDPDDDEPDVA